MSTPSPEALLEQRLSDLASDDRAPGTIRRYKSAITSFLAWYAEVEQRSLALDHLSAIVLVGHRNFHQQTQGRSTSTVNGHVSALRAWCAWLVERRHLGANPARGVKLVGRQAASDRRGLEPNQVHALLRQIATSRDALRNTAIMQLLLQTGMRLDECSHLSLEDIAFGERSGRVTIRAGKGNKARVVPLNTSARLALADYLAPRFGCDPTLKAVAVAWPRSQPGASRSPLWHSQKSGALTTSAMRQMIDGVVRDASRRGLVPQDTSVHTLRHTFAHTYLAEYPGDLVGLATLLGHTFLDTTRVYSQPSVEQRAGRVEHLRLNAYSQRT